MSRSRLQYPLLFLFLLVLSFVWNYRFLTNPGTFGIFDWQKDLFFLEYHFRAIKQYGEIPLGYFFAPAKAFTYPTLNQTFSTVANPEVFKVSPFSIFIPFFEDATNWFRFAVFLHFIPAALGVILFGRRHLSPVGIVLLYSLTMLNPWLMQHIAIGYTPWINLAWALFAVGVWTDAPRSPLNIFFAGLAGAVILWQGGLHLFLWLHMGWAGYLVLTLLFSRSLLERRLILSYFLVIGVTLFFAWPGLVAGHAIFGGFEREAQASLRTFTDLYHILTDTGTNLYDIPKAYTIHNTNIYDASLVMGRWFIGLFLASGAWFLLSRLLATKRAPSATADAASSTTAADETDADAEQTGAELGIVLVCVLVFFLFSLDTVWRSLVHLIPLLGSENYPWRFLFIGLVFAVYFVIRLIGLVALRIRRAWLREVLLLLLVLPVLAVTYNRNSYFNEVATISPIAGFVDGSFRASVPAQMEAVHDSSGSLNARVFRKDRTPAPCLIAPAGWKTGSPADLLIEGGRVLDRSTDADRTCFEYAGSADTLTIRFHDYGFGWWWNLVCGLLLFLLLGAGWRGYRGLRQTRNVS